MGTSYDFFKQVNEIFNQLCSEWAELAPPDWKASFDKTGMVVLSGIPKKARKQIMDVGGISVAIEIDADNEVQLLLSSNYWGSFDESTIYDSLNCFQQFMSDYAIASIVREHRSKWDKKALTKRVGVSTLDKDNGWAL